MDCDKKNSSRFATGKLVTSIGIKETEKDSVTQEKGTKLFIYLMFVINEWEVLFFCANTKEG
ncbi:hypothetical protein Avbf_13756 [Armadillidium vulgare]|nr:hypothetical protein Avbf_13756 [Armadillidium vulgare]